jgi:uncharacterized membrane protein YphA (DoxX/SURF4 family)
MTFDFDALDHSIAAFMNRWGTTALRVSLALIFVWFGILKPLGLSPAEPLVEASVQWMPLFSPATWLGIIGWWEVAIGVTFLFRNTIRIAIALLALQMVGTFLPLVMLPQVTFQPGRFPLRADDGGPVHHQEPADHIGGARRGWDDSPEGAAAGGRHRLR